MPYGYRFHEQRWDRICEFLFTNSGMAFCDESLRAALEITRTMVPARYLSKRAADPGKLSGVCVPVTKSSPPKELDRVAPYQGVSVVFGRKVALRNKSFSFIGLQSRKCRFR